MSCLPFDLLTALNSHKCKISPSINIILCNVYLFALFAALRLINACQALIPLPHTTTKRTSFLILQVPQTTMDPYHRYDDSSEAPALQGKDYGHPRVGGLRGQRVGNPPRDRVS
ncbi:hypothetical protein Droror1_Dr00020072 [Drosera rotundifolia]